MKKTGVAAVLILAGMFYTVGGKGHAQQQPAAVNHLAMERAVTGDAPDDPGPLATGLSAELKPKAIEAAMTKVADWQLTVAQEKFNQQWTFAALYDGLLAASATTNNPKYKDAVEKMADGFNWQLIDGRFPHADDFAIGQAYMDMYLQHPVPQHMASVKANADRLVARPDDPKKLLWWWCDALFMAPPVMVRVYKATGDRKYLDYMDKEWWETSASLYDPSESLYFRDARYFTQKQANGKKIFWGRGNGWVMGAFVKVLTLMPNDYPTRGKYIEQYKAMAAKVAAIQSKDGLWRAGLLDPDAYELPEVSGSAFFTYSLAWGINEGILDRKTYEPVVQRAWAGMLSHIYATGRLGCIQPIDAQPGAFKASASSVYGVGGFLLAGSEVDRLARHGK
ncbi:MAG: glycoside hydrolase family 88 protein [Acidobacteriaceae bacterium]|nr:glycoside hydrolase family 88 protein [Acidobacteriaceae bacterium]